MKKSLTQKQGAIQRTQTLNDLERQHWQQTNGFDDTYFAALPVVLIQAQQIATNILKQGGRYLGQNEAHTLNSFLQALRNTKKRKKLTQAHAYRVMNIGKAVNRKMFKAEQAIN